MPTITSSGTIFKPETTAEIFNKVKGTSSLAKLCGYTPIPFAGTDVFVFSMDGEASIVGEGGTKPAGLADLRPITIKPFKVIYQHRVTDEFIHMAEEKQLPYLRAFVDGFGKKIARALDIIAFHGVNPYSGNASPLIGSNHFDAAVGSVSYTGVAPYLPDDCIDNAVGIIQRAGGSVTGIAMSPSFGAALGAMKRQDSGAAMYPEYRFGGNPATFGGLPSDVNSTVGFNSSADEAIIGDFANAFRWGYAEEMKIDIIEYGDPDGQGDLKRTNQIVLRSEAYIGYAILDPASFVRIVNTSPFTGISVAPEEANTDFWGTKASAMQTGISVADGAVTGTLKYLSSGQLVNDWGAGNFLALKFTSDDWTRYTSVKVGLEPSEGTGLVEIKDDPDKNGVFKITRNGVQRFKIVATDGKNTIVQYFDLSKLNCQS